MLESMEEISDKVAINERRREMLNLPNLITMLRVAVIPVLFLLLLDPGRVMSLVIAGFFIAAAITDLLDGYIARKYDIVTKAGKILDPIADKLIVSTAMILMIPLGRIPAWIVALIVMRDFAVDGIRHMSTAGGGHIIAASNIGKQKTLSQVIAISALLIHYPIFGADAHKVGIAVLYLALALTIWSGLDYVLKFSKWALKR